jgi:hypothetical protein
MIPAWDGGMCEKCAEIDEKVEHYRSLASRVLDDAMIKGMEALIADLLALKEQLHPAQDQRQKFLNRSGDSSV